MYFDIHIHASAWDDKYPGLDAVSAWMDQNSVERSIVLQFEKSLPGTEEQRERMLANFRQYRGQIDFFNTIPFHNETTTSEMVALLAREKEAGAIGYGELYYDGYCDSKRYMRLYAACAEIGFPVLFHLGDTEEGLPHLENAVRSTPGCTFIAHAPGWWKHIHTGTCERLLREYANLYGDLSAGSGAKAISKDLDFGRGFLIRNNEKLMFGTDTGFCKPEVPDKPAVHFSLFESLDLPDGVRDKVYRQNANNLFPLAESLLP